MAASSALQLLQWVMRTTPPHALSEMNEGRGPAEGRDEAGAIARMRDAREVFAERRGEDVRP